MKNLINLGMLDRAWSGCAALIDFNTSGLHNLTNLFTFIETWSGCINLINFDTSFLSNLVNLYILANTWARCYKLISFDTEPIKNLVDLNMLSGVWDNCRNLTYLNFDNLPFQKIQTINSMCSGCNSLIGSDTTMFRNRINSNGLNVNTKSTFTSCLALPDYADIPDSWK